MRSVNVAELKNRLSKYLSFAKGGEEVVIRDRNLPVAKLVPFLAKLRYLLRRFFSSATFTLRIVLLLPHGYYSYEWSPSGSASSYL